MKLIISKLMMESNLLSVKFNAFLFLLICQITLLAQPPSSVAWGRITGDNGQPLEGATINERGTRNSATTGLNAMFRLNV